MIDRPVIRRPGQNACVVGTKGFGKTTLVHSLVALHPRVLIVDPHREYPNIAVEVRSRGELEDFLEVTGGSWRICYYNSNLENEFEQLCVIAANVGNLLFVVEDPERFCNPSWIGQDFYKIVDYGRHLPDDDPGARPVDFLICTRNAGSVNRAVTREAYEFYCFNTSEPRDIEWLQEKLSRELIAGLKTLPPHHYRFVDLYDRTRGVQEFVSDPAGGPGRNIPRPPGADGHTTRSLADPTRPLPRPRDSDIPEPHTATDS